MKKGSCLSLGLILIYYKFQVLLVFQKSGSPLDNSAIVKKLANEFNTQPKVYEKRQCICFFKNSRSKFIIRKLVIMFILSGTRANI